mmetsp:Transcript_11124/g.40774  ORF Transcript_11124/g.40774 Transcript_11124/m.40774 type:complete len:733 (+) Transcript_11124:60-2258(+)
MASLPVSLEEVRALTDQAVISRLLQETIARERSIDAELEALLAKRSVLDSKVQSLADAEVVLESVAVDSEKVAASVTTASAIAEKVSRKVKELDLAQSRVQATIDSINSIVDRANCINGVSTALQAGDFEAAAEYVETFERVSGNGPEVVADAEGGSKDQRESIAASKRELIEIIRSRFSQAAEKNDHAQVLRFCKLFKPLGLREEGLKHFTAYLRAAVGSRARDDFNALSDAMAANSGKEGGVDFVGTVTNLFKDLAVAVEENEEYIQAAFGGNAMYEAIQELQRECDQRGVQLLKRFIEYRRIPQMIEQIRGNSSDTLAPRQVEMYLEEMLMFSQRNEEYVNFMVGKLLATGSNSATGESPGRHYKGRSAENMFRTSEFSKKIQEIVSYYITMEEFFMVENVKLAISIDELSADALTSSVVDDTFFILQKCSQRAIATANVQCTCAALNHVNNLLSNEYLHALRNKAAQTIKQYNQSSSAATQASGVAADVSRSAVSLNNMDVSADYAQKLRVELETTCGDVFSAPHDREKIKMCLAEIAEASATFKQATSNELDSLSLSYIQKIRPSLESIGSINYDMSEEEYAQVEVNDPWVQPLMYTVEHMLDGLPNLMTPNLYDSLVHLVVDFVVSRAEALVMHKKFNQLGGLQFDREIRALVSAFSGMTQRTVREKFARLTQIATVLNLEKVSEILDYWGENSGPMTWRLTPAELRRVLALRSEFSLDAISALPL